MSIGSSIRKMAGQVLAFWCALVAGPVLDGGSLQAQTPLDEFKSFLTNPPPIEEIVVEQKLAITSPLPKGYYLGGSFFQLRLLTNAYFARQMQSLGEAPGNQHNGNLLEGAWDNTCWQLNNNHLNLWHNRKQAELTGEVRRSLMFDHILRLGMDIRLIGSTIVWNGDTFTAQGTDGSRFEGRIELKTAVGLPESIAMWVIHTPDFQHCVDYTYREDFHPWFPVSMRAYFRRGNEEKGPMELNVSSLKMGSALSQENFFPGQFTNLNTITVLHTNGTTEFYNRKGKITFAPTNAPLPAPMPPHRAPAPPSSALPGSKLLIIVVVCLSIPPLLFIFLRSKRTGQAHGDITK